MFYANYIANTTYQGSKFIADKIGTKHFCTTISKEQSWRFSYIILYKYVAAREGKKKVKD